MDGFKEFDNVIYTDAKGNTIDTFVIYDTDDATGLTHINHLNLLVTQAELQQHPTKSQTSHLPVADANSFLLLKQLINKYGRQKNISDSPIVATRSLGLYNKAS